MGGCEVVVCVRSGLRWCLGRGRYDVTSICAAVYDPPRSLLCLSSICFSFTL